MNIADINTLTRFLVDADTTSYSAANLLITINNAYEDIVGKLIALDTNWLFGDSNYTSLPTGLSNLVAGTQDYQFNSGWLTVQSVKVLDNNGIWHELDRVDLKDIQPHEEYQKTNGLPQEYAVREDFVMLFPAPAAANITATNGLEIMFQRTASVYTSGEVTTGTKTPGFASPYHQVLAYKAAIPYAQKYKPERVGFLMSEANRLERELLDFYSKKDKDIRKKITTKTTSFR